MHLAGVDLAWADRRPTGIAVLDDAGTLVSLGTAVTDAEVLAALEPFTAGPCLVGIDAPLVVVNTTGNRPGEAALNRDFARFDAGAHPSNTGKPELAAGPRGARLAAALGLDIDPDSTCPRRAVEVYPHPATVALFRLGRTLKYKNKPGRSLGTLREELAELVRLVGTLADADVPLRLTGHPGWQALDEAVHGATRKADLRRAEDQVDAVVCAYVALLLHRTPERLTTYGDLASGYIVTPTLPADHRPAPRSASASASASAHEAEEAEEVARRAVREYAEQLPSLQAATDRYVRLVTALLDDAGINYLNVTGRAKSVASFAAKASRSAAGAPAYPDPLRDITDQVGVRVITYLRRDVDAVAELLSEQFTVLVDRDLGLEAAREGRFGYASRHLLLGSGDPAGSAYVGGQRLQVQVRTVLQHAWAEFEHAIRYKGTVPEEHAPDLDRRFTLAAGLLELADREFSLIHERMREAPTAGPAVPDEDDPRIGAQELAAFLAGRYADAGWSRPDHYAWASGLLLELGVTSLDELGGLLAGVDSAAVNARMGYRRPPTAVRRLDDALLCLFGERYVGLHGNAHRMPLLRTRHARLTEE
jgi:predicted RNase H-like nuclease/ppGpp synthetase/RelA/SpoT-type nucleotidyltranferase